MRRRSILLAVGVLTASLAVSAGAVTDDHAPSAPVACNNGLVGGVNCIVTKRDLKQAKAAFQRGVKLHDQENLHAALAQFEDASRLAPRNVEYLTAREVVKAKLVFGHIQAGNRLMTQNSLQGAAAEFHAALELDPSNEFARERLQEATRVVSPEPVKTLPARVVDSGEIHLESGNARATFHFTGDVKELFNQLAAAYSMKVQFDDSVKARQVTFNVDNVDFFTALKLACEVSKNMWAPLSSHQLLIADDTMQNHKQFDRMVLRTFVLPAHSTPQESTELLTAMKNMFDLKFVSSGQSADTVEVRGPQAAVDACATLLEQLSRERPQVMFDVRIYQISHQLTRNIGMHIPDTFNLYNIPAVALAGLAGLGGQNIQQLINQLISSGGINQAGSTGLAGLLSQLGGQSNSIFSQPLATFGGGLTFMGLSLDQLTATLAVNESWVRSLSDLSVRTGQGVDATFHVGERYPIMNASYAPIYNSPQIAQVLGNQSYTAPFPSVSYEDLGLNMKAKPEVHGDGSVSVDIDLQLRSLTGQSANGVPVISNREFKGSINLKDGEPAFVAGQISRSDTLSMAGIPGLGLVPLLNQAMVTNTKEEEDDELMIAITPHVLSNYIRTTPEIWISER
jgi:general secretion pathway protein D